MKRWHRGFAVTAAILSLSAHARDTTLRLPFEPVVTRGVASGKLDANIKFYLEGNAPAGGTVLDEEIIANKKTSGIGKSDEESCEWALMSALISLQQAARKAGANSVTHVVSFYNRIEFKDATKYECHAGGLVSGVVLKGKLVKH